MVRKQRLPSGHLFCRNSGTTFALPDLQKNHKKRRRLYDNDRFRRFSAKSFFAHCPNIYTLMLRVFTLFALASGFLCLTAFRGENPKCNDRPFASNTTLAGEDFFNFTLLNSNDWPETDTSTALRVLMLNYNAYDSAYAKKVEGLIRTQLPTSNVSELWDGNELASALSACDVVVITYPSAGTQEMNKTCGKLLAQYVQEGGVVIFTGTDDYRVLQQFGLFKVDFGYFCQDPLIHEITSEHPILEGTSGKFSLSDYAYPLDISDPDFVTLVDVWGYEDENSSTRCWSESDEVAAAELRNYPVVGYKNLGAGKIIYLGMEYYFDQAEPARILANTLRWATQPKTDASTVASTPKVQFDRPVKRSEEVLQAGSGKQEIFDLKIYPNPYYEKGTLDIELKKAATVAVEMTDETGRIVAVLLPQKSLTPGLYRLELPNLPTGVYFVKCNAGEKTTTRQVVKTAR